MYELWIRESHELAFDSKGPRLVWFGVVCRIGVAAADDTDTDADTGALYL
jgi:hypothetical protein